MHLCALCMTRHNTRSQHTHARTRAHTCKSTPTFQTHSNKIYNTQIKRTYINKTYTCTARFLPQYYRKTILMHHLFAPYMYPHAPYIPRAFAPHDTYTGTTQTLHMRNTHTHHCTRIHITRTPVIHSQNLHLAPYQHDTHTRARHTNTLQDRYQACTTSAWHT